MPFTTHLTTAFAVLIAASAQLTAQGTPVTALSNDQAVPVAAAIPAVQPEVSVVSATPASFAPTVANSQVGVRMLAPSAPVAYAPEHEHMRRSVAMMIVGGAILIVGAVVGGTPGTIIMIGGGTVGIIGLVRYLQ
jgi:hypothetical protein